MSCELFYRIALCSVLIKFTPLILRHAVIFNGLFLAARNTVTCGRQIWANCTCVLGELQRIKHHSTRRKLVSDAAGGGAQLEKKSLT